MKVEMTTEGRKYWFTLRYCFHCRKVTVFWRCGNCNKFFCGLHAEIAEQEMGDYGSVLDPGGYPIHDC